MGRVATVFVLLCSMIMIAMPMVLGLEESPQAVEQWIEKLGKRKEKITKLHFYLHETGTGQNLTIVTVTQSNITSNSPTMFGKVSVIDDILRVGPEPNSTIVGRAQGIVVLDGLEESDLLMTLNFVFTAGKYNGSTLSLLGHNPLSLPYREMPIVGGSGVFRLARGIVTTKTYSQSITPFKIVSEFQIIVIHY